ncbi:MAG: aminodeoxychorismate synthase component I, partial [Methylotenera sp.]
MLKKALPYHHDSAKLFECIAHLDWPMMLDSGQAINPQTGKPGSQYGRYDILVASPVKTFVTYGKRTEITENDLTEVSEENPFELIKSALAQYISSENASTDSPFSGGAVGYFGYDLALYFEKLPSVDKQGTPKSMDAIPELMIGIYDWAVVVDHRQKTAHLIAHFCHENAREKFNALEALFYKASSDAKKVEAFKVTTDVISNMTKARYAHAFDKVKNYILEGDCYQVNLAQRFSAQAKGDGWLAYKKLREISPAPFMAYMQLPHLEVLSASPERFLQVVGQHVETRPIKGTRPRSDDAIEDAKQAIELQNSLKDRAENLMIVDLLRNDIGKN